MKIRKPLDKGKTRKAMKAERDREKKRATIEWHEKVTSRTWDAQTDLYGCAYCHQLFPREYVCGHHVLGKGSHPHLRFDPDNGVTICLPCHSKLHNGEL